MAIITTMKLLTNYPIISNKPSFQRKLREDEKPEFSKTMNEAFDYLDIKNRALIIHGSSFPDEKKHKVHLDDTYYKSSIKSKNPYIGSPYFNKEFLEFVKMNGFNAIQLGPNGKLNKFDNSPYKSSIFAKNELFIDYDRLKTKEYANILTDTDTEKISYINKKHGSNYDMTDFDSAKEISNVLLNTAYQNFKTKLDEKNSDAIRLNIDFLKYKEDNKSWLEKDGIFNILSDLHGTDDFNLWDNDLDKELISKMNNGDKVAQFRYNQLISAKGSKEKIEQYEFTQFLTDKQIKEDKIARKELGMKYIGDLLVGYSHSDEWSNPDAFLKDWRVGAEYGGKNNGPQLWEIPVLNPEKLFNKDGSLGVAGKLLKEKIDNALDGVENIRVDNVMGLVDPYIYKSSTVNPDGTIDKSNRGYMSAISEVDPENNYTKILHNILLPSLKEHNINPKDVIWEDLGAQSKTFQDVFYNGIVDGNVYEDEKMKGIMYSTGVKMEKARDNATYSFLSTHDNEPTARFLNQEWIYENEGWNPMYLAGFLVPPTNNEQSKISSEFCKKIDNEPRTRLKAKYAELFRGTQNVQIFFPDLFGIDKVYNQAGNNTVKDNWKLRLNSDYQDTYYKSLITEKEPVMNMPELLGLAVNSKVGIAISQNVATEEEKIKVNDLLSRLAHWKNVLKEPEG